MGHHFCRIFLTLQLSDALCLLSFRQGVADKGVAPVNVSDSLYFHVSLDADLYFGIILKSFKFC